MAVGGWQREKLAIGKDYSCDLDISFKVYLIELLEGGKRTLSGAEVVVTLKIQPRLLCWDFGNS